MPEFEPQFAPENLDAFTTDYLTAAAWLQPHFATARLKRISQNETNQTLPAAVL